MLSFVVRFAILMTSLSCHALALHLLRLMSIVLFCLPFIQIETQFQLEILALEKKVRSTCRPSGLNRPKALSFR